MPRPESIIELTDAEKRDVSKPPLEFTTALHTHEHPGRCQVAVKVIDIFGKDTMTIVPVNVG